MSLIPALEPQLIHSLAYFSFRACLHRLQITHFFDKLLIPTSLPPFFFHPSTIIHSRHSSFPVINHNLNFIRLHLKPSLKSSYKVIYYGSYQANCP